MVYDDQEEPGVRQQEEAAPSGPQHRSSEYHQGDYQPKSEPRHAAPEYEPEHGKDPDGTDNYGTSARDDMRDRLGLNGKHRATPQEDPGSLYRGKHENDGRKQLNKLFKSDNKLKKRLAIAGAAAGGSTILGIVLFFALLPLKIDSIVKNIEGKFSAETSQAMETETNNLFSNFVRDKVLPNLGKGTCRSTIDASCVSASDSSTPFGKLYNAWRESKLEQRMAEKGFLIGKTGGKYYVSINGNYFADTATMDSQIKEVIGGKRSFFDLSGDDHLKYQVTRTELRDFVKQQFKDGTLWDRVYNRFKVGRFVEAKYGVRRCVFFCDVRDKFTDTIAAKKVAGQAYLIRRFVEPFSTSRALVLNCILAGTGGCDTTPSEKTDNPEDAEKITPFEKDLRTKLLAYEAEFGVDKLADVVKHAEGIQKDGLTKYMIKQLAQTLVDQAGGGEAAKAITADATEKFIPIAGWINTAAKIIDFISNAGPKLKVLNYAIYAPMAVTAYMTFRTAADEQQLGHVDATTLGSLTDTLDSGGVDASTTPMWAHVNDTSTVTTTSFVGDLIGSAYADTAYPSTTNTPYRCANGKGVVPGKLICSEEVANGGIGWLNDISATVHSIPGWGALNALAGFIGSVSSFVNSFVGDILGAIPGVSQILGAIGQLAATVTGPFWQIVNTIIPNPLEDAVTAGKSPAKSAQSSFLNAINPKAYADDSSGAALPGGGRIYDMMVAGADFAYNGSCQAQLGCASVTDAQVADAQDTQTTAAKDAFERQPLFARMFSTDTPYSMVSRLALAMPTNLLTATNNSISTLFTNPIARLGTLFSTVLSGNHAFAAATPTADAYGIRQMGYTTIADPQAYWNANCINGPMATYDASTDTLDVTDWLNSLPIDKDTGQPTPAPGQQNQCLLIHSAIQSSGGSSDTSLLPKDPNAPTGTPAAPDTGGSTTLPTGSAHDLAQQIWDLYQKHQGISFQTSDRASEFKHFLDTGKETSECGTTNSISPKLLGLILALHEKYNLVLGVFIASHACGTYHELGDAVDLNGIADKATGKATGNRIDWLSSQQPLLKQFYGDASALLSANGGGGMGQIACFNAVSPPKAPKGVTFFKDDCSHVHMDIGKH